MMRDEINNEWKTTACPYDCPCTCSMLARQNGGKIELRANPANSQCGFLCLKGLRFAQRIGDPRRLLQPLRRHVTGWEKISWDEALALWAEKVSAAVARYGPLSVMSFSSAGSMAFSKQLIPAFYAALGGFTTTKGSLCSSIGSAGLKESTCGFGVPHIPLEDVSKARGVLLWGRNSRHTQPQMTPCLEAVRRAGGETACLEVRLSATAARCDRFWRIAPGGDWALAAWLCRRLVEEQKDCSGWRARAVNPEEFLAALSGTDKDGLLAQAGLDREAAEEIYRWLLAHRPAAHIPAYGAQRYLHGDMQFRWIFALAVLCGGFEDARAGLSFSKDEGALFPAGLFEPGGGVRRFGAATWPAELLRAEPPVRVLNICCANPAQQSPDTRLIEEALAAVDFKVCSEVFMTRTAELCDLVLPASIFLEEDDWIGSYGHSYLSKNERVAAPRGECRSDWEVYGALAKRLGLDVDMEELFARMNGAISADARLREVSRNLYTWDEPCYWKLPGSRARLPETPPRPLSAPPGYLRLVTVHSDLYINGQNIDAPAKCLEAIVNLPEKFCREENIAAGDALRVVSANGAALVMRAAADGSVTEGCAWAAQGLPGLDTLTSAREAPGSGAAYAECFVKIEKL